LSHTPGPWKLDLPTESGAHRHISLKTGHGFVMFLEQIHGNACYKNMDANARLIAAAPDLLEALRRVIYWEDHAHWLEPPPVEIADEARAAIAKAEGPTGTANTTEPAK
jgi:hypothetical protein